MRGHASVSAVRAHDDSFAAISSSGPVMRQRREQIEVATLSPGAALSHGGGDRAVAEPPDEFRTCFEKDRDRIIHSTAYRRLAGKTQVVVYPRDHQRTRLTHALEVAQVATAIARGVGANPVLTDAIALGHDCGHGPGGHASEDAFDPYILGGYRHGPWGADVVLAGLNLCRETLDGIRNHSWSCPAPSTVEGEIVSWADRIAYCAHDLEDALHAGIVQVEQLPPAVVDTCGERRSQQLSVFINAVIQSTVAQGVVSMDPTIAGALADLRQFNYDHIYMRPESLAQSDAVVDVLRALVDHLIAHPQAIPGFDIDGSGGTSPDHATVEGPLADPITMAAVTYVAGMTDRFAFDLASELLGYDPRLIPVGIGRGA